MRKTFEMVQIAVIGALTGSFIGGIVLQGGMDGALWGGSALAAILAALVWPLLDRPTALMRAKYGAAAFLPGMLVGGSQWLSIGVVGAAVGGAASSVLAAFFVSRLIMRHEEQGRYIRTRFHYVWLFSGGSLATFFALNALFVAERAAPWQTWARSIPMAVQSSIVLAFVLLGYMICIGWKRERPRHGGKRGRLPVGRGERCWLEGCCLSPPLRCSITTFCLFTMQPALWGRCCRMP
ncbi:hypothetical protein QT237_14565 [Geobacillus stearothermophilus]|nr:hypothetical protein QT237_14565 [Geobacillus stearothermophilus]